MNGRANMYALFRVMTQFFMVFLQEMKCFVKQFQVSDLPG
ncbi:hypothetical protein AD01_1586 [Escherichia coli 2-427-07_S4_C2]|nr:hypothetical protein AD01_1586 [Escherichia coli 2-427-07_S4_C2]KEJ39387.1 hypothetical protein AB65_3286 [Escherichia coli 2-460-02_S1_C3]KEO38611.1 hypothetical protein AB34_3088 [Escherichia coli 2-460-02_S1_C2]